METKLERAKGIEPSYAAWEAAVLPLNYTRSGNDERPLAYHRKDRSAIDQYHPVEYTPTRFCWRAATVSGLPAQDCDRRHSRRFDNLLQADRE